MVNKVIDKPEGGILASELEGLTSLAASEKGITDLTGLEYCTNLTSLILGENNISDISPLMDLARLEVVNLAENPLNTESVNVIILSSRKEE